MLQNPTVSLRSAYEAGMAKAINDAREGCRELFADKKGPGLMNPMSMAIRSEVRAGLDHLPRVLVDLIDSYRDFIDVECFKCAMPEVIKSVRDQKLLRSIITMAIGTDNLEMFDMLITYYENARRYIIADAYFTEFGEFVDIADRRMNSFRGTMRNIIHYLGRGDRWLSLIRYNPCTPRTDLKYALMGSGPVDEVRRILGATPMTDSREYLILTAFSGDANPEIIKFLRRL